MDNKSSTAILVIALFLINIVLSVSVSRLLATRVIEQSEPAVVLGELEKLYAKQEEQTRKLDLLIDVMESKHGHIKSLHEQDNGLNKIGYEHGKIVIGLIPATTSDFENHIPYAEIIERDLKQLANNWGSDLEFSFIVLDAYGQARYHLEGVQYLKSQGVDLVIGGMWSSHASASLSYCNDNDMLLFSPSSTTPSFCFPNRNMIRLAPNDETPGPVIARILNKRGVNHVVFLQRGDAWADRIYDTFEPEYLNNGGNIVKRIRYPWDANFSSILTEAEEAAAKAVKEFGWESVGVELLSFSECVEILRDIKNYPTLYNLTWYGSDGTSQLKKLIDEVSEEVEHVEMICIIPALSPSYTETYDYRTIKRNFEDVTGESFDYYDACTYDLAMIIATSVIRARTDDVETLKEIIPKVCRGYNGITGNCTLDENFDRATSNYAIQAYITKDSELGCHEIGFYHDSGKITWYHD